ncbi:MULTISPECIES: hypothetical protein [Klebsiella]|uniref:hypothetical protein n=1 Tax=Klebsiella TaxID=570 RepID=UPI0015E8E978|nr:MULTISPECIES: hypothetical protein [Klebsiella]HCB0464033.1 hypothetical protein [Klebsiella pneumoniae]MCJ3087326.1 hypothetical protein [Klebsiella quasipneumoniae]GKO53628.1 hypothetical protein MS6016_09030 [Klebsiella variicola]HCC2485370.1 hypothetical protein [Klebsiella pneumoniae]HDK6865858.1 hypothetical protein [Klebsiella pneumoniae]
MLFFALRVLLKPKDPDLFAKGVVDKDIRHFEQAMVQVSKNLSNISATPSVHKQWRYTLKISIESSEGIMAGVISKQQKIRGHDKDFHEFDVDNYPPVIWIWDKDEQILLVEKKTSVFRDALQTAKAFEDLGNNEYLSELGLRVFIEPCLEIDDFWSEYHNLEFIDNVTFTLVTPNIFGNSKEALTAELRDIERDTNANSITTSFENKDGNLKLANSSWASTLVDWVKDGGGSWFIKGRKTLKSKTTTVSSNKTAKVILVEGDITEVELNGYSAQDVKDIISIYQNRYTFKNEQTKHMD